MTGLSEAETTMQRQSVDSFATSLNVVTDDDTEISRAKAVEDAADELTQ